MAQIHGFELVREQEIPEINSTGRLYRHVKTGAELFSLLNDDENKCFGITFATPPSTSNGIAHILEHSVLCGSRKYPVKEPFVELIKGSLNTFLNAFTFSDKTMYPLASQNTQDFYNLIDVYLDAVFYPRITPEVLMQEGWHYELDSANEPMEFKGVVFNEMKGAYSSPEGLLGRYSETSLFPDTPYGVDSGGDPEVIPDLTYDEFKKFHETYYHPTNARIYFYGDDDPDERLRIVNEYLSAFDKLDVSTTIPKQEAWDEPRRVVIGYDAGEESDKKAYVTVNWMLPEPHDIETLFGLRVLSEILTGTPASPLQKALIDSGLGEDVAGGGLDEGLRQMTYGTGLKGVNVDDASKVETLIFETLENLVKDGIDPATVEAAMNTTEFELREFNTGSFPKGLAMSIMSFWTWLYEGDPMAPLAFEGPLNAIKAKYTEDPQFFSKLIKQHLIENQHHSTVLLKPDAEVREQRDSKEKDRLAKAKEVLTPEQINEVIETTQKLREMQETPDAPEDLAKIPSLSLADIDRQNKVTPIAVLREANTDILFHDLFTNGILYFDLGLNLMALPADLLPYVPLFGTALLEMGTDTESYIELTQRIGRKTGGIDTTTYNSEVRNSDDTTHWLFIRGKSTLDHTEDLFAIYRDILLKTNFDDQERFLQIALQEKAVKEAHVVPAGHVVILNRMAAHINTSGWVNEQMGGASYIFFLRNLVEQIKTDWQSVLEKLVMIQKLLVNRAAMLANVTIDDGSWQAIKPQLVGFLSELPDESVDLNPWTVSLLSGNEGLTIPAQVNYVGKGGNLYDLGYRMHGSAHVITKFLGTTYLWERVRVQGGAYGGFAVFQSGSGMFRYASYRDPNLMGTLDNYHGAAAFLKSIDLPSSEVERSIIGAIGDIDTYQLPDAKGYASMQNYLTQNTEEMRQKVRDEVLSTSLKDFHTFGEALAEINTHGQVVVLGSADAINAANNEKEGFLQVTKLL